MSIEKMTLVQMSGNLDHFQEALFQCSKNGAFHLEQSAPPTNDKLSGEDALEYLKKLDDQGIDHKALLACEYLKTRFGRLPEDSVKELANYTEKLFVFIPLLEDGDYVWGIYVTPTGCHGEIDGIFYSLYFERVVLPGQEQDTLHFDAVLSTPAHRKALHSEKKTLSSESKKPSSVKLVEENPYKPLLNIMLTLSSACGFEMKYTPVEDTKSFDRAQAAAYLEQLQEHINQLIARRKDLTLLIEQREGLIRQLEHFGDVDAKLEDLFGMENITAQFGRIPVVLTQQLAEQNDPALLTILGQKDGNSQWLVYFIPTARKEELEQLVTSLHIERISFPDYLKGTPMEAKASLMESIEKASLEIAGAENELKDTISENKEIFIQFYSYIKVLNQEFEKRIASLGEIHSARLVGYIPKLLHLINEKKALRAKIEQAETSMTHLDHMMSLDVSLDDIFACKYLKVRFGRLPVDSYQKLSLFSEKPFIFLSFSEDKSYHWGAYFTPIGMEKEVDDIFSALYWERLRIPDFAHGTPCDAKDAMRDQIAAANAEIDSIHTQIKAFLGDRRIVQLKHIFSKMRFKNMAFDLRRKVNIIHDTFYMVGFTPKSNEENLKKELAAVPQVEVTLKPSDSDKRLKAPTVLKNRKLFKPFEMFVDMYGLPSYTDIDPTTLVGITYSILFGIMFGDLGQGLVLSLVGFILAKKGMALGSVMQRIGISSAIFGFAYGSVFGIETLLDPFFINVLGLPGKPIHVMDPATINVLLIAALGLGIVFIVIAMLTNIYNGFKHHDLEKALFSHNGITGLVFYGSVLFAAVNMFTTGINLFTPVYIICLMVLPLIIIMFKHPLGAMVRGKGFKIHGGFGDFFLENFFELFEVLLNFVTNTMSFLRVGGFIISHAGMMAVVLTLSEMMGGGGSIITLIFGNLFVICLEGFIVGIQILRLEFYELFGRYYEGQGKAFVPIKMQSESSDK